MNGWAGKAQWDLTEWAAKCRPLAQLQIRLRGVSRDARERKVIRCGLRSPDPALSSRACSTLATVNVSH